jgi:hypothetical protein
MNYRVTLNVRQRGAVGIFSGKSFEIDGPPGIERNDAWMLWYERFGDCWEPGAGPFTFDPIDLQPELEAMP